ncbi:hypothetical protein ACOME3_001379 [Neoechinorhynchus agilis]
MIPSWIAERCLDPMGFGCVFMLDYVVISEFCAASSLKEAREAASRSAVRRLIQPIISIEKIYIKERIGGDGQNKVFRGEMEIYNVPVAVKESSFSDPDPVNVSMFYKQLMIEIECLRLLYDDRRAMRLYFYEVDFERMIVRMVMDLGKPDSVLKYIEEHTTLNIRTRLWYEMVLAVHHAHCKGIIHADIKPSNFIFGYDGYVKLVDFGCSLPAHRFPNLKIIRGTYIYMSPEIIAVRPYGIFSMKSDVWALGCILYEMVYGNPYFSQEKYIQSDDKIALLQLDMFNIQFPPIHDSDLYDLLRGCMALSVYDRLSSSQILKHPYIRKMVKKMNREWNVEF